MNRILSATLFVLALLSAQAQAAIYKCDDGKGNVIYTHTPCVADTKEVYIPRSPPTVGATTPSSELHPSEIRKLRDIERREEERPRRGEAEIRIQEVENQFNEIQADYDSNVCDIYSNAYDRIEDELRGGHTKSQEEKLRRDQEEYKAKMRRHCR